VSSRTETRAGPYVPLNVVGTGASRLDTHARAISAERLDIASRRKEKLAIKKRVLKAARSCSEKIWDFVS